MRTFKSNNIYGWNRFLYNYGWYRLFVNIIYLYNINIVHMFFNGFFINNNNIFNIYIYMGEK